MQSNVFVRNNLYDERDGLEDLIYANFGSARRIRDHLFPNAKPQVADETVEKFMSKYTNWLSKRIENSDELEMCMNGKNNR